MTAVRSQAASVATLVLTGCATLEEMAVGRADRLDGVPFNVEYVDTGPVAEPERTLVLPIQIDDARNREDWPSGRESAFAPLLAQINEYLRDRHRCELAAPGEFDITGAPYLYLGSAESDRTPPQAAVERRPGAEYPAMVLYVEKQ